MGPPCLPAAPGPVTCLMVPKSPLCLSNYPYTCLRLHHPFGSRNITTHITPHSSAAVLRTAAPLRASVRHPVRRAAPARTHDRSYHNPVLARGYSIAQHSTLAAAGALNTYHYNGTIRCTSSSHGTGTDDPRTCPPPSHPPPPPRQMGLYTCGIMLSSRRAFHSRSLASAAALPASA